MQTKFKRHQKVKLLRAPNVESIEPYTEDKEELDIKAGMLGEINIVLPNGTYHVRIFDKKGKVIAYVAMDEDGLEAIGS